MGYSARAARAAGVERNVLPSVNRAFSRSCSGATCAEAHIVSQAITRGVPTQGGTVVVVNAGRKANIPIGAVKPACGTCQVALPKYGIK